MNSIILKKVLFWIIFGGLAIFGLITIVSIFVPTSPSAAPTLKGLSLQSILSIAFSAIVATATVVYAILTKKLVDETMKMRKVETEPKISITREHKKEGINFQDLVIKNIGNGPAYNIQFELSEEFYLPGDEDRKLSNVSLIENGINYLAPSQEIRFFLNSSLEDKNNPENFTITTKYSSEKNQDKPQHDYEDKYILDFSLYGGLSQLGKDDLYRIGNNIKKLRKTIDKVTRGTSKRMDVNIYTSRDREKERKKRKERIKKLKKKRQTDNDSS